MPDGEALRPLLALWRVVVVGSAGNGEDYPATVRTATAALQRRIAQIWGEWVEQPCSPAVPTSPLAGVLAHALMVYRSWDGLLQSSLPRLDKAAKEGKPGGVLDAQIPAPVLAQGAGDIIAAELRLVAERAAPVPKGGTVWGVPPVPATTQAPPPGPTHHTGGDA